MSKFKKIFITAVIILGLGYALSYAPDGGHLISIAKLIQQKAETDDSRVHSLDLEKYRPANPLPVK